MKKPCLALLVLLSVSSVHAQSIKLPATVNIPTPGLVIVAPDSVDADAVAWFAIDPGLQIVPSNLLKDDRTVIGVALSPGSYRLRAIAAKAVNGKAALSPVAECVVVVAGTPIPPSPIPPGPTPPGPTPGPAPIPAAGFHVMIVYETADLKKMPKAQEDILYAKAIRDYLGAKTTPTPDGAKRGYYIVDQNVDFSGESKIWQDAFKRPRTQVPWILVSNGTAGYEGPLPANVNDTLALLKQYGN